MKKVTLMLALLFTSTIFTACEKEKEYCWICTDNAGLDQEFCDQTEEDIENMTNSGWSCQKK